MRPNFLLILVVVVLTLVNGSSSVDPSKSEQSQKQVVAVSSADGGTTNSTETAEDHSKKDADGAHSSEPDAQSQPNHVGNIMSDSYQAFKNKLNHSAKKFWEILTQSDGDGPCSDDAAALCKVQTQYGGGAGVLRCLYDKYDLASEKCRDKVLRHVIVGCLEDIEKFCSGIAPGRKRFLACLKRHKDGLGRSCLNDPMMLLHLDPDKSVPDSMLHENHKHYKKDHNSSHSEQSDPSESAEPTQSEALKREHEVVETKDAALNDAFNAMSILKLCLLLVSGALVTVLGFAAVIARRDPMSRGAVGGTHVPTTRRRRKKTKPGFDAMMTAEYSQVVNADNDDDDDDDDESQPMLPQPHEDLPGHPKLPSRADEWLERRKRKQRKQKDPERRRQQDLVGSLASKEPVIRRERGDRSRRVRIQEPQEAQLVNIGDEES